MRKSNLILLIYCVVMMIGIILLNFCIDIGTNEMSNIMGENGGHMDGGTYQIYLEQAITKYRYLGSILTLLGGFGFIKNIDIKSFDN